MRTKEVSDVTVFWNEDGPDYAHGWACRYNYGTARYEETILLFGTHDTTSRTIRDAVEQAIHTLDLPCEEDAFAYEKVDGGVAYWSNTDCQDTE